MDIAAIAAELVAIAAQLGVVDAKSAEAKRLLSLLLRYEAFLALKTEEDVRALFKELENFFSQSETNANQISSSANPFDVIYNKVEKELNSSLGIKTKPPKKKVP
jgi:hypothetical protein